MGTAPRLGLSRPSSHCFWSRAGLGMDIELFRGPTVPTSLRVGFLCKPLARGGRLPSLPNLPSSSCFGPTLDNEFVPHLSVLVILKILYNIPVSAHHGTQQ
jgi:hypothetical protein